MQSEYLKEKLAKLIGVCEDLRRIESKDNRKTIMLAQAGTTRFSEGRMIYPYQRADIDRLMDSSRPLTLLMKRWIEAAESGFTDLGYDDWKAEQRRLSKAVAPKRLAAEAACAEYHDDPEEGGL